jgi:outer membrane protein assembly factor BamB
MRLSVKNRHRILVISSLFLSSCETTKVPLPGKREPFICSTGDSNVDITLIDTPQNPRSFENNHSWLQSAYTSFHAMPPFHLKGFKVLWKEKFFTISKPHELFSSPVSCDGMLCMSSDGAQIHIVDIESKKLLHTIKNFYNEDAFGCGLGLDQDRVLYITTSHGDVAAFDLIKKTFLWKKHLKVPIRSCPTIDDDLVFYINVNNEIVVLDKKSGEPKWSYNGLYEPSFVFGAASPAVKDNMVIAPFSSGEMYAFSKRDGQVLWNTILTPGQRTETLSNLAQVKAAPVVDGNVIHAISFGGRFSSFNLDNGDILVEKNLTGANTPVGYGDFLFLLTNQGELLAIKKNSGQVKWNALLDSTQKWSGPLLSSQGLIVVGSKGSIKRIDPQTGREIESLTLELEFFLTPIIVNGMLYIFAKDGHVVCVG